MRIRLMYFFGIYLLYWEEVLNIRFVLVANKLLVISCREVVLGIILHFDY